MDSEIRGRKIDSPNLVVVREIRELDEEQENTMIEDQHHLNAFGSGSEDLINILWNSR